MTTTTHKTLRGPRGGMIFCKEEFAKKLDSKVFPGMQGPLEHVITAKVVCLYEASKPEFKEYMEQTLKNVQVMVNGFKEAEFEKATSWMVDVLKRDDEEYATSLKDDVVVLTSKFNVEANFD